jgi:hypothetical protein
MNRSLIIAALLAASACSRPPEEAPVTQAGPPEWSVYRAEREVLRYKEEPGPLTSRGILPPGAKPVMHPFLTASSLDPAEEDSLRRALESSKSPAEFKAALEKAGYAVRKR